MVMQSNTEDWTRLDPQVKTLWTIEALVGGVFYFLLALGGGYAVRQILENVSRTPVMVGVTVGVALWIFNVVVARLRFDHWRYRLGVDDIAVARGIWWKTWTFVPRARIQHVDVTSGPIARALGLASISLYVGGHAGAVAVVPGLAQRVAEQIRAELLRHVEAPVPPVMPQNTDGIHE